jgi:hypothetical protein
VGGVVVLVAGETGEVDEGAEVTEEGGGKVEERAEGVVIAVGDCADLLD